MWVSVNTVVGLSAEFCRFCWLVISFSIHKFKNPVYTRQCLATNSFVMVKLTSESHKHSFGVDHLLYYGLCMSVG